MKKILKTGCKIISPILAFCVIFAGLQAVLRPNKDDSVSMIDGFYELDKNSIDVLFMGASQMYITVNSQKLTENYGISSFDFGAANQYLTCTYYYLQEALKVQHPKLVMVEVTSFFLENADITNVQLGWTYALMDLDREKWNSLLEVSGGNKKIAIEHAIPLFAYHSRWSVVGKDDIMRYFNKPDYSTRGYYKTTVAEEQTISYLQPFDGEKREVPNDTVKAISNIVNLCRENDINILFFKSPAASWTRNDSKTVKEYMEQNNLSFIELNDHLEEIGIDGKTDFADELHLNESGAEKTTDFIAKYLKENYSF